MKDDEYPRVRRSDYGLGIWTEKGGHIAHKVVPADAVVIERDTEEGALLTELRRVSVEVSDRLHNAIDIAKVGGVSTKALDALLMLANARQMTPTVTRVLREAGIDPDPLDAIVIERSSLPPVAHLDRDLYRIGGRNYDVTFASDSEFEDSFYAWAAVREYRREHPPVDEAQVERIGQILSAEDREHQEVGDRASWADIARRLYTRGVRVTEDAR